MELENKKPRAAGDGRGGSYDPTNPLHLEKALQAQRRILQMLQQGKASAQWRRAPENTGIVFLTPKFQFALQMAFSRVKLVAGCQHVPLIDLMTHQEVRTYYAYLVALEMAGASNTLNPTRYSRVSQQPDIEGQRSMLLRVFQQCGYDSLTGTLVFQNLDNSGARLMRQHVERHRQEQYAATGTLETQGSLPLLTLQPFKKPRHAIDPRPEYLLQMRAGMATGRRH